MDGEAYRACVCVVAMVSSPDASLEHSSAICLMILVCSEHLGRHVNDLLAHLRHLSEVLATAHEDFDAQLIL